MRSFALFLVILFCVEFGYGKGASSGGARGGFSGGSRGSISSGSRPVVAPSRPIAPPSRPIAPSRPVAPSRPIAPSRPTTSYPSRPVIVQSRPVIVYPSRPAVTVIYHPPAPRVIIITAQPRPNLVIIQTNRVVIIRSRPSTYVPVYIPVYHPYPLYSVIYTTHYYSTSGSSNTNPEPKPQYVISDSSCTRGDKTIYGYCQEQVQKRYDPDTLNSTWRTCCSAYAEIDCYIKNAANWCSEADTKVLFEHSQNVAKYFSGSICRAVDYTTWDSTCNSIDKSPSAYSQQYYSSAQSTPFIALPSANGTEKSCMDKLRSRPEGDLTQKCMNASLNVWDQSRRKMIDSQVWETCCAMYDTLDCLQVQAESGDVCTSAEQDELANYKKVAAAAFSSGICRAVPYQSALSICRGEAYSEGAPGAAFASLPSILVLLALTSLALIM